MDTEITFDMNAEGESKLSMGRSSLVTEMRTSSRRILVSYPCQILYWLRRWIFLANHIDCTAGISNGTKCVTLCDDIDEPRGFEFLHLYFEKVLIALGQPVDRHAGVMSLNVSDFVL